MNNLFSSRMACTYCLKVYRPGAAASLSLYGNDLDSASSARRHIWLVFSNLIVELSWYFQLSRLNDLASTT